MFIGIFCVLLLITKDASSSDIELLRSEVEEVKQSFSDEICGLKKKIGLQEKVIKEQLMRQDLKIMRFQEKLIQRQLKAEDLEIMNSRNSICSENRTQTESTIQRVAFYAHLTQDLDNLGIHVPIKFDAIRFNEGKGYKSKKGKFRAPVSGIYFFIWTTSNSDGTAMQSELMVNGKPFGRIISDAADHNDWATSTAFGIVSLKAGDRVWIRTGTVHNLHHLSGEGYGTSSFAGFLLS